MTYKEIFLKFKGLNTASQTALEALMEQGIPADSNVNELVLSVALCDYMTDLRNEAKKVLKKHGNEAVKEALALLSRRNYQSDSGNKNLETDLPELEKIAGFKTTQFAKYLYIRKSGLRNARDYFFEHATDEELRFYFVNDLYSSQDGDDIRMYPGTKLNQNAAQIMLDSVREVADLVSYIYCTTDGNVTFNLEGVKLPKLYELGLHTQMESLPLELFEITSLHRLGITANIDKLPEGFGKLKKLTKLYICAPVSELPMDIFTLENMEWFSLDQTKLETLPEEIGNFKNLTTISIEDNPELKNIPKSVFDLPKLSESYKKDIRAHFMPANEYEVLFNDFEFYLSCFKDVPAVQEQIALYKAGEPNFIGELILAVSRCYYDDEHGVAMTNLYAPIEELAPESLKAVNKAVKNPKFIDQRTITEEKLAKIKQKAQGFEDFNADKFLEFIREMIAYVDAEYPFEKW
ncbi:MAG: leucine-rich repeat domain-containing protein [Fluviicola sp.]